MDTKAEATEGLGPNYSDDFTEEDYRKLAEFLLLLNEIDQENKRKLEFYEEGKKVH